MGLNRATAEQILSAANEEMSRAVPRLIGFRNRLYKETGSYPDDLGAAIERLEFVVYSLMSGLITPARVKKDATKVEAPAKAGSSRVH